jgi:hypothetical protein
MNCGFSGLRVWGMPARDEQKIFGTWDFKWPREKRTIRIAFQELRPEAGSGKTLAQLIDKVEALANTWMSPECPFTFDFLRQTLPAPARDANGGRSPVSSSRAYVEYDELVSFAPLPIPFTYDVKEALAPNAAGRLFQNRTITHGASGKDLLITLPTAQLGRFARRCDYGVPTVYLGKPHRTVEPSKGAVLRATFPQNTETRDAMASAESIALPEKDDSLHDYFGLDVPSSRTKEFEGAVVHEFGHVLGIPHLHQSPLIHPTWKEVDALEAVLEAGIGVTLDSDFIQTQITLPLPATAKGLRAGATARCGAMFSDWPLKPAVDADGNPIDSSMTHPFQGALLLNPRPLLLQRFLEPQPADLDFLRAMYS